MIFSKIRTWSKNCFNVLRNFFGKLVKIAFYVCTGTSWRKNVFLFDKFFFSLADFEECITESSDKTISTVLLHCFQRIRNDVTKTICFKKLELFYHFPTLNDESFGFLVKNIWTLVETVLECPGYKFVAKFLLKIVQIFFVFSLFWLNYLLFWWKLFGRVSKTVLYVPEEKFEEKNRSEKNALKLQSFPNLSRRLWDFWLQLFTKVDCFGLSLEFLAVSSDLHWICPKKRFRLNIDFKRIFSKFSDFAQNLFGHLARSFGQVFHEWLHVSMKTSSWNTFHLERSFCQTFLSFQVDIFQVFSKSFLEELSKLHSLWPGQHFMEKVAYEKKCFSFSFGHREKPIRNFGGT